MYHCIKKDCSALQSSLPIRFGSRTKLQKASRNLKSLLLADTMREFISYAVGCMLGRYSLDKPGLILANQGETADDYRQEIPEPTFAPDEDNVIPLLDGDWFEDDITERFKEFLKVTFGTEHYEENLTFLENSLFPANSEGKKRKDHPRLLPQRVLQTPHQALQKAAHLLALQQRQTGSVPSDHLHASLQPQHT